MQKGFLKKSIEKSAEHQTARAPGDVPGAASANKSGNAKLVPKGGKDECKGVAWDAETIEMTVTLLQRALDRRTSIDLERRIR